MAFSRMPPAGPQRQEMAVHDYFPVLRGGVHKVGIPVHDYCFDDGLNPYCIEDDENPLWRAAVLRFRTTL
uniref:Uncharacterized protein n=1 Tax=Picea sitchensis TaxID=3332 RepID=D5A8E0_PICSI|nr:unknown [Picea sitchensis]